MVSIQLLEWHSDKFNGFKVRLIMEKIQTMFKILEAIERHELNSQQFCTFSFEEQDFSSSRNIYTIEEQDGSSSYNVTYTDIIFGSKERLELHQGGMYIAIFVSYDDESTFGEQDFPQPDFKLNNQEKFGAGIILLYEFWCDYGFKLG